MFLFSQLVASLFHLVICELPFGKLVNFVYFSETTILENSPDNCFQSDFISLVRNENHKRAVPPSVVCIFVLRL